MGVRETRGGLCINSFIFTAEAAPRFSSFLEPDYSFIFEESWLSSLSFWLGLNVASASLWRLLGDSCERKTCVKSGLFLCLVCTF